MDFKKLKNEHKHLRRRIIEISHKKSLSHLGSCLTAVDIIGAVYQAKKKDEPFVLSSGHAAVALYAVLEKQGSLREDSLMQLNIHPDRNASYGIDVSSGSLGHGLGIATGMALGDRKKNVYCLISDGECAEGSIWEALNIAVENKLSNLNILVNANGWAAYKKVDISSLLRKFKGFGLNPVSINTCDPDDIVKALSRNAGTKSVPLLLLIKTKSEQMPFLKGLDAHYYVMSEKDFKFAMEILS
ncbi:MAG: thiamine pyrophosphate-dependent enzyme [Candidatus Omnitrophica bacterium]|jgi:transketolase|nr:thiamine pyrophosphate-dependent enzyme [Candidatus Omnitrophota bacterium]